MLTDNVNLMAMNLANQVHSIAGVTKAFIGRDLKKIGVDVSGVILELTETVNRMTESLSVFADEIIQVAKEGDLGRHRGALRRLGYCHGCWQYKEGSH